MSEQTLADLEKRVAALEAKIKPQTIHYLDEPFEVVPFEGELRLKTWVIGEAERCGVCEVAIHQRIKHNKYPDLVIRRVNKRVVFVSRKEI